MTERKKTLNDLGNEFMSEVIAVMTSPDALVVADGYDKCLFSVEAEDKVLLRVIEGTHQPELFGAGREKWEKRGGHDDYDFARGDVGMGRTLDELHVSYITFDGDHIVTYQVIAF